MCQCQGGKSEEEGEEEVAEKEGVSQLWSQYVFSLFEILKPEKQQLKEEGRKGLVKAASCQGTVRTVGAMWEALGAQEKAVELAGL